MLIQKLLSGLWMTSTQLSVFVLLLLSGIGQSFANNYSVESSSYQFDDISGSGTILLEGCDDCGKAVDLGFEFTYYGRTYTQLYVSSNGFVIPGTSLAIFGDRSACCHGRDIPFSDKLAGVIALWWTDLSMKKQAMSNAAEEKGRIFVERKGSPGEYVYIVQFDQVRHFHHLASDEANTFQLKLKQIDNSIEFHYKKIVANKNIHTIGIESPRQNTGVKYFRTTDTQALPAKSENFALRFEPPEYAKLTGSLRYGAEGNTLQHVFKVEEAVNVISDISIVEQIDGASLAKKIDFANVELLTPNPASFSLAYTLFDSLSSERAASVHGDFIDFRVNGNDFLTIDSQTVFVKQSKILDDDEATLSDVRMNVNATLVAFKSKSNIAGVSGKNANALDVFFTGRDPVTQAAETHQLTRLSSNQVCGAPYVDADKQRSYLFVICQTGSDSDEVVLHRYDLDSYLDDTREGKLKLMTNTQHEFFGDIQKEALVVARADSLAYVRHNGVNQDIYLNNTPIHLGSGTVTALAMDDAGEKLVYVIDGAAYFYDGNNEYLFDSNDVTDIDISGDGTLIAFNSRNLGSDNADGSLEVFTVAALVPLTGFIQKTDLDADGVCRLPRLSQHGERITMVCNQDLLKLGNNFSDRQAVFVVDEMFGETLTHLITGVRDKTASIADLAMSRDGANVVFQDGVAQNAFRLEGLSNVLPMLENAGDKTYPSPFVMAGKGKSGAWIYMNILLLLAMSLRILLLRK